MAEADFQSFLDDFINPRQDPGFTDGWDRAALLRLSLEERGRAEELLLKRLYDDEGGLVHAAIGLGTLKSANAAGPLRDRWLDYRWSQSQRITAARLAWAVWQTSRDPEAADELI